MRACKYVSMCVCVCVCVCACVCVCLCVGGVGENGRCMVDLRVLASMFVCLCEWKVHLCLCFCLCACVSERCMRACAYVCEHV